MIQEQSEPRADAALRAQSNAGGIELGVQTVHTELDLTPVSRLRDPLPRQGQHCEREARQADF